jgi:hypothetical protein
MWNYLSASLMRTLQSGSGEAHKYSEVVRQVEKQLLEQETISGHTAAQKILSEIFKE